MQVFLEQRVVGFADLFDQGFAVLLGLGPVLVGNLLDRVFGPERLVTVDDGVHPDEIDDAEELVLAADGQLDGHRIGLELGLDLRERPLEVRADAVHLVDEAEARYAVLVGLTPHRLGLGLDAGHRVEHRDGAIEDPERPLDFGREIDVAGRVDDVDAVIAPEAGGRGGRDGDAALLFLLHPVHDRRALVHFAELVGDPRVEEDALGGRGLTGIDVGHDADVPRAIEGDLPWHYSCSISGNDWSALPPVVRERLVGFGHAMRVLALLHRATAQVRGVEQLIRQLFFHRLAVAA